MGATNRFWDPTLFGATDTAHVGGIWLNGHWYPPILGGAGEDGTDGAGGDAGDGSTEGDKGSDGTPPGDGEGSGGDGDDDKPTLSQKQVDAIVAREKSRAARGKIDPKDLGFESAKEAKDFMDTMKKKAEGEKAEGEKALEDAITEAKAEAKAEVLDKANERLTRAEFKIAAGQHEVAYIDDAYEIAQKLEIWKDVDLDDEGVVSGFDDHFFEELKKEKPYLFKGEGADDGDRGKGSDLGAGRRNSDTPPNREEELKTKFPALQSNG